MAINKNKLVLISQNGVPGAPKIWIYTTADTVATVNTADYFLTANDILSVNDMIFVVSSTGGTPVHTINIVNAVSSTTVDVSDGLVITATDSD
tara:strand:- start:425 stop:703 length:279 start_codon:yes stop_codon:yes gene_type:complete